MYKPSKLEQKFFKHKMQVHKGLEEPECPTCQRYKKEIGNNFENA